MKRVFSLVLAIAMVLGMSSVAFAADSPTLGGIAAVAGATIVDKTTGKEVEVKVEIEALPTKNEVVQEVTEAKTVEAFIEKAAVIEDVQAALDELKLPEVTVVTVDEKTGEKVEETKAAVAVEDLQVASMVEVTVEPEVQKTASVENPVQVDIPVTGIKLSDVVIVMHKLSSGKWEVLPAQVKTNGLVTAKFTSFSPVVVLVANKTAAGYKDCAKDATCVLADYTDVNTKFWYHDALHFAKENKLMGGTSLTTMDPNEDMTRQMIWTVLARFSNNDVATYKDAKDWVVELGFSNGEYAAESATREEAITTLYRYVGAPAPTGDIAQYADAADVSFWAVNAMKWAQGVGILKGYTDNTIKPQETISRAEFIALIQRYVDK